jgi:hypothetical protein
MTACGIESMLIAWKVEPNQRYLEASLRSSSLTESRMGFFPIS